MNNERSVILGNEFCRFNTFQDWVNVAASWIGGKHGIICIDALGRVCQTGKQFMRARDDGAFPVCVYEIELENEPEFKSELQNEPPKPKPNKPEYRGHFR